MLRQTWVFLALALALSTGTARAQSPDAAAAKEHFVQAEAAMQQGDFSTAAALYELAAEESGDASFLLKAGDAREKAGDCDGAITVYTKYIDKGTADESLKASTRERVQQCEAKLASAAAAAAKDEFAAATPEPAELKPAPAPAPPAEPAATTLPSETPPAFSDAKRSWHHSAAWMSVGLSVAFATTSAVLAISASTREQDLNDLIDYRDPSGAAPTFDGNIRRRYEELVDEGERIELYARLALIGAGLTAAAAVTFFIIDPSSGASGETAAAQVAPMVSPNSLGVSAGFRF